MTRRTPRLLLLCGVVVLTAAASPASAQSISDRGKRLLPKLFAESMANAVRSTVKVNCDAKVASLGTIVTSDGYVLTKGSELRGAMTVETWDGMVFDAERVSYHKPTDLALLKVTAIGLDPVRFATSKDVVIGNWVAAAGIDAEPVAVGVVSAGVRKLYGSEARIENLNKGYLGIGLTDSDDDDGVVIREVMEKAAAAKAGLEAGDIIRELAGETIKDRGDLLDLLEGYRPGDVVKVRVSRGDEELTLKVKLGQRADFSRKDFQNSMGGALSGRRTGFPLVIQHDTVLRPHECGGPLVDLDGKVLGINIARAGRVESWALPVEVVVKVIEELKAAKSAVAVKD